MKQFKLIKNQKGLSLLELVVSIAIMSILLLGIAGIVGYAAQSYSRNSNETTLQSEVQSVLTQITNLIQDTNYAIEFDSGLNMLRTYYNEFYYEIYFAESTKEIYMNKFYYDPSVNFEAVRSGEAQLESIRIISADGNHAENKEMADYVENFSVAIVDNVVTLSLTMKKNASEYNGTNSVKLRNRMYLDGDEESPWSTYEYTEPAMK